MKKVTTGYVIGHDYANGDTYWFMRCVNNGWEWAGPGSVSKAHRFASKSDAEEFARFGGLKSLRVVRLFKWVRTGLPKKSREEMVALIERYRRELHYARWFSNLQARRARLRKEL